MNEVLKDPITGCPCGCCEMAFKFREEGKQEIGCFCQHESAAYPNPGEYPVCGCKYCGERGRFAH